jgi:hypothetical protein
VEYPWNADPRRFALPYTSITPTEVHNTFVVVQIAADQVLVVRADGATFRSATIHTGVAGFRTATGPNRYAVTMVCADGSEQIAHVINGRPWTDEEHPGSYVNLPMKIEPNSCPRG